MLPFNMFLKKNGNFSKDSTIMQIILDYCPIIRQKARLSVTWICQNYKKLKHSPDIIKTVIMMIIS